MAVMYKLKQDNRTSGTKLFYARAVQIGEVTTNDLAAAVQEKCTVNEADTLAVIKALIGVMTDKLQESYTVKLDGFGSFKVGLKSYGSTTAKDFNVNEYIHGMKINFLPEGHKATGSHKITRTFLDGCKVQKYE